MRTVRFYKGYNKWQSLFYSLELLEGCRKVECTSLINRAMLIPTVSKNILEGCQKRVNWLQYAQVSVDL